MRESPWRIEGVEIIAGNKSVVWELGSRNEDDHRLIAAAPDMLDALKAFCGDMESLGGSPAVGLRTAYEHALAVIAKAEGK